MTTEIRTINARKSIVEAANSRWNWLYKFSSVAALSAGILFLVAIIDLTLISVQPGAINGWLSLFQNNWLVVIFKLHAAFNGIHSSLLDQLNLVDIIILACVATMYIGLYRSLRGTSKIWSFIALAQPYLAILLFIVTKTAGRSGVMGAGLVISVVMLRGQLYNKLIAYIGILSAILLLSGDFGVSMAPSNILAIITGFGYVLMMTWFFLVARRLYQLGLGN